ncbi:hypothetical protein RRG49_00415 [Mycoplasmopsis felis]|uniref:MAG5620 family putative phospho-sugar mutase n=1 Tax=Mycoplasmopsis felis TaxID=33923 RepID=UPI002AFEE6D6|nr:hypothetical protein [Mycoplasmopsis felis]WQQ09448.1 hypothetical protein RRG41_00695 [Mycoplasmopsis felis]
MKLSENQLKNWYSFYYDQNIIHLTYKEFLLKINDNLLNLKNPRITFDGIEFLNNNIYELNSFNIYYLIILIDIYLSENINKRKKQIFLGKDNNIDLEKIILLKKFFNKNNIKVFEYNISYVNDFIVLNTLSDMDLDLAIYLYKNEINNKYYLKIYNKDGLLSKEKINELINKSHNFDKEIKLSENKDSIQLNIDKFLNYYINKNNNHITKSEFKQDVLNIKITIEDPKSEYILLNLLRKFGYLVKRNIQKFKWETKIKKYLWIYFKWLNYNLNKYDLLIYIDKFNQLSIYLKIKNKFILIKDEELTYLYINYYYLTWKQNKVLERNKIFIPHYTSSSILNLLNNFNIPYDFLNNLKTNEVLLANQNKFFSSEIDKYLSFNNVQFVLNFCFILSSYKNNNNLLDYKFLKMKKYINKYIVKNYSTKFEYKKNNELIHLFKSQKILNKFFYIEESINIDLNTIYDHTFLKLIIKDKNQNEYITFLYYDFYLNNFNIKIETKRTKNIFFFCIQKILIFQLNKSIQKILNLTKQI